jgi:hypothetical protein
MNAEQRKIWSEFARMVPEGVTTFADRWAVEIIVCAMTKFRMGTITTTERGQLGSLLSCFA